MGRCWGLKEHQYASNLHSELAARRNSPRPCRSPRDSHAVGKPPVEVARLRQSEGGWYRIRASAGGRSPLETGWVEVGWVRVGRRPPRGWRPAGNPPWEFGRRRIRRRSLPAGRQAARNIEPSHPRRSFDLSWLDESGTFSDAMSFMRVRYRRGRSKYRSEYRGLFFKRFCSIAVTDNWLSRQVYGGVSSR